MRRKKAILFVEKFRPYLLEPLARGAASYPVERIAVVPPGTLSEETLRLFDTVEILEDWTFSNLQSRVCALEKEYELSGIFSADVFFHKEGMPAIWVAQLCEQRGLPSVGADALWRASNKFLARDALAHAGISGDSFGLARTRDEVVAIGERIGYPIILKPLSAAGSSLILRANHADEAASQLEFALRTLPSVHYGFTAEHTYAYQTRKGEEIFFDPRKTVLVERYIPGREASVECISTAKGVYPLVVHDKIQVSEAKTTVYEDILVTPPSRFSLEETEALKKFAVEAVKAVGLTHTFSHVELRYDPATGPELIEINPRVGGAYIAQSIETVGGLNPYDTQVRLALGLPVEAPSAKEIDGCYGGFAYFNSHGGVLRKFEGLDAAKNLPGILWARSGYKVGTILNGTHDECFLVTAWAKIGSAEEARSLYDKIKGLIQYEVC